MIYTYVHHIICIHIPYIHIQMQIYSHQLPMLHTSTHQEIWIQTLARFYLHQNLVTSQPQVVLISGLKKNVENPVIPPLMLLNPLKNKPWFQTGFTMFHVSWFNRHFQVFPVRLEVLLASLTPALQLLDVIDFFRYLGVS